MKKINLKAITIFVATVVLLIFLHFVGALGPVERVVTLMFNPVGAKLFFWSTDLSLKYNERVRQGNLAVEVDSLKKRVEELTVENASMKKLQDENSGLRQHLKFLETGDKKKYILADIISRQIFNGPQENSPDLIINKGKDDGLIPGLAVLDETGAVIGKIKSVDVKTARVILVTNVSCKLAASLQNLNRTIGVTSGNLGLTINMDYIPQSETVSVGDLVVTSGLEVNIQRGLLIGQVVKVDKGSNDIWQSVNIQPASNLDNLSIVSIMVP